MLSYFHCRMKTSKTKKGKTPDWVIKKQNPITGDQKPKDKSLETNAISSSDKNMMRNQKPNQKKTQSKFPENNPQIKKENNTSIKSSYETSILELQKSIKDRKSYIRDLEKKILHLSKKRKNERYTPEQKESFLNSINKLKKKIAKKVKKIEKQKNRIRFLKNQQKKDGYP